MELHFISFTQAGFSLSERIYDLIGDSEEKITKFKSFFSKITVSSAFFGGKNYVVFSDWVKNHFEKENCLVFVGAAGIAVRSLAPFVKDKRSDPCVLVIDEKGEYVIPILSGHIGGGNEAARKIAGILGAKAVITTASDVNNLPAIDEFAKKNNLLINDMEKAKEFAAKLLEFHHSGKKKGGETLPTFSISPYIKKDMLNLLPKCVILGIGCKKGKSFGELEDFVLKTLKKSEIDARTIEKIASIDLKKDEKAILDLAEKFSVPFVTFSAEELNKIEKSVSRSDFVAEITGTDNVCERAVWVAGADEILVAKKSENGMTIALGMRKIEIEMPDFAGGVKWQREI